jgi:hypothetical protein
MTTCFSPDCFSACKTTQELPVTQLARHVVLFHLVIADNWRPETLSLPHGLAPPTSPLPNSAKPPHSEPESDGPAVWTNKTFLSTCGVVFIRQYLIVSKLKVKKSKSAMDGKKGEGLKAWLKQ